MPAAERSPIFILGNPRSGTTLLRLMLTCHRSIVIPPECGFLVWLYDRYRSWDGRDRRALIGRFVADVMKCRKFETWGVEESELRGFMIDRSPASYAEAASLVYEQYALSRNAHFKRWGDKNNFYIHHISTLDQVFPGSFFIHIVRDGRNVACSYRKLKSMKLESRYAPDLPAKIEVIAREWAANNDEIGKALGAVATRRVHTLRFEDLVTSPERELRLLCAALGEDYDSGMLEYHTINRRSQLEPAELLGWKQKTLEPPIPSEVDRYERELEAEEKVSFERVAGDALRRYGYLE